MLPPFRRYLRAAMPMPPLRTPHYTIQRAAAARHAPLAIIFRCHDDSLSTLMLPLSFTLLHIERYAERRRCRHADA